MTPQGNIVRIRASETGCALCNQSRHCMTADLPEADRRAWSEALRFGRPLERGQYLCRAGEPLKHLAIVRSGSFKVVAVTRAGMEQIVGIHLPGDIVGLDAMGDSRHPTSAVALETTSVCLLPWDSLDRLTRGIPELQTRLLRFIGGQLANEHVRIVLLSQATARERLAAFLLHLSTEYQRRGFAANEFNLSLSRAEIANYLALAIETVSRLFTAFQIEGLIAVSRRFVKIHSLSALEAVSESRPVRAVC